MVKKIKLNIEPYENIFVFAISAPMRDYKFVWSINNRLDVEFYQTAPLLFYNNNLKQNLGYAIFKCAEIDNIIFLNNRNEDALLIPSMSSIDYFLIFSDFGEGIDVGKWANEIRSIQGVSLIIEIPEKEKNNFRHILSDIEDQETQRNIQNRNKNTGFL